MKILTNTALAAATALWLSGSAMAGKENDTLVFASERTINTIDPYYNSAREALLIIGQLAFDTLVYSEPGMDGFEGLLAESWEWIDDVTIEFQLRQGIMFHDGVELTADDVVYTFEYISDPKNPIEVQQNVNWLKGAEKTGKYSVRINLNKPFPTAMEYFAGPLAILPVDFFGEDQSAGGNGRLVGTGPYKIEHFSAGSEARLTRYDGYFTDGPKGSPEIGNIVFRMIPDKSTEIAELLSGGVDWLWNVGSEETERLATVEHIQTMSAPSLRVEFVQLDAAGRTGPNPLTDIRVRKAMTMALDRERIATSVQGDQSWVPAGPCFETQFGCLDDLPRIPYDPEGAKQLLSEAGYPNGFELELYAYGFVQDLIPILISYWKSVGIEIEPMTMTYSAIREKALAGQTASTIFSYGSYGINDTSAFWNYFFQGTGDDYTQDPIIIEALKTADATVDPDKRKAILNEVARRLVDQAYTIPLEVNVVNYAFDEDLDFTSWPDSNPRFFKSKWK